MRKQGEYKYGALDESESPDMDDVSSSLVSGRNEFRSLIDQAASSVQTISSNVSGIQKSMRQIGTASDSIQLRNRITSVLQDTNRTVSGTQAKIKRLKELAIRLNKEDRLQEMRITDQFMDTMKTFQTVQKKVASQLRSYPDLPKQPAMFGSEFGESGGQYRDERESEQSAQMQKQEDEMQYDLSLLAERERQVKDIESAIVDVNEIFRDLGAMVYEQGEMIDSIEANVERGGDHVEAASQELQKAIVYQRKARRKQCCIITILVVVLLVVGLVVFLIIKR